MGCSGSQVRVSHGEINAQFASGPCRHNDVGFLRWQDRFALQIVLEEGRDMKALDLLGHSDPYVLAVICVCCQVLLHVCTF